MKIFMTLIMVLIFSACGSSSQKKETDSWNSGASNAHADQERQEDTERSMGNQLPNPEPMRDQHGSF